MQEQNVEELSMSTQEEWVIREDVEIMWREKSYSLTVMDINYPGITTKINWNIWVDYPDVLNVPRPVRMHVFPGARHGRGVALQEKVQRMELWMEAIQIFAGLYTDVSERLTVQD